MLLLPLLMQGLLLITLFHLLHEAVHDTPFASKSLNCWVALFTGLALFIPPLWFRYFHHAHHRYTQDPKNDPELEEPKPANRRQWVWHLSGIRIWSSQGATLWSWLWRTGSEVYIPDRHRRSVRKEIWLMWICYGLCLLISLALQTQLLLLVWILPLILGQPFLRLYLLAEHTGCEHTSDMFANTRTVLAHPLLRWFTWNMPYHAEHHAYPTVPFHQLPKLHTLMLDNLQKTEPGYVTFNKDFWRTLPASDRSLGSQQS